MKILDIQQSNFLIQSFVFIESEWALKFSVHDRLIYWTFQTILSSVHQNVFSFFLLATWLQNKISWYRNNWSLMDVELHWSYLWPNKYNVLNEKIYGIEINKWDMILLLRIMSEPNVLWIYLFSRRGLLFCAVQKSSQVYHRIKQYT